MVFLPNKTYTMHERIAVGLCGPCRWCWSTTMKFYPTWCMCNLLFEKAFSELVVFLLCMAQIWNPPAVENDYDMLHHPQMKSHLRGIIIFRFYQVHVLYWITKFLTTYKIYRSLLDSSIPFTRLLCYAEYFIVHYKDFYIKIY